MPKNLIYLRTAQGSYEPAFSIDLQVLSSDGEVLFNQERFGLFRFSSDAHRCDHAEQMKNSVSRSWSCSAATMRRGRWVAIATKRPYRSDRSNERHS